MTPKSKDWNENCCLYFISVLKHHISGDFDYAHKLNSMEEIEIPLPTIKGQIAFDFMDSYIREIKKIQVEILKVRFKNTLQEYKSLIKIE